MKDFPRKCNRIFGIFSLAHCIINMWNSLKQKMREAKVSSMWTVRTSVVINRQSSPKWSLLIFPIIQLLVDRNQGEASHGVEVPAVALVSEAPGTQLCETAATALSGPLGQMLSS